jgi:hypothetical protein
MSAETSPLSLPSELIEEILLHLHPFQIVLCRQVCRINDTDRDVAYGYARALSYKYWEYIGLQQVEEANRRLTGDSTSY